MRFSGKTALVTGASRGVGKQIALALAREGCDVAVAAKSVAGSDKLPGSVFETAAEIERAGRRAVPLPLDVRDGEAVERAVWTARERLGRIDFLVNNAGALFWQPMVATPLKRFDLVMGVNARGAFACTRAVLPAMIEQRFGHILMMSPPLDGRGAAGKIAYAASKLGMTLVAIGLAEEVREHNVAANALWPATLIESAATVNWGLGGPAMWRKPDILADATLRIFEKPPSTFTGQALIDEDFLRAEGITDFARYRCDPAAEPPRVGFDFRVKLG